MISEQSDDKAVTLLSIGIFAWNEERAIATTLQSLFQQTVFRELSERNARCEVVCLTNGCTDSTPVLARQVFAIQQRKHSFARSFVTRVVEIPQRGKVNAWNQYIHGFSAREAGYLVMMDADILIHRPATLWNLVRALETNPEAAIAVDRPCKDILFKPGRSVRDWLSLAVSQITLSSPAQLCAQLYCMRSSSARDIYLPKDLPACEDGFIKSLVCTENLSRTARPERIAVARDAAHTFEAYTSPAAILRNQKRQVIGQTIVHLLVDKYLPRLPLERRRHLAQTLRALDRTDPPWLKRLTGEHLRETRWFWRLYPGLASHRFLRMRHLGWWRRILCLPGALAGACATLLASFLAFRTLKTGSLDYWPKADRMGRPVADPEALGLPLAKSTGLGK